MLPQHLKRFTTRVCPSAAIVTLIAGLEATPAHAGTLPSSWKRFLEQPKTSNVMPVSATVFQGGVTNRS